MDIHLNIFFRSACQTVYQIAYIGVGNLAFEQQSERTPGQSSSAQELHPEILQAMTSPLARQAVRDLPKVGFTPGGERSVEAVAIETLANANGLTARLVDGKYEYHLIANGEDKVVASIDSKLPLEIGLRQADGQLSTLSSQKKSDLQSKYGADFSVSGEVARFADENGRHAIPCREPNLKELAAIEAALRKNWSGVAAPKFYFLKNDIEGYFEALALTGRDETGRKAIFVQSKLAGYQATNADVQYKDVSMEFTLAHELNHAARMDDPGHTHDNGPLGPASPEEIARYDKMGWSVIADRHGNKAWALQGKNGEYYTLVNTVVDSEWLRINRKGQLLNGHGKPFNPRSLENPGKYRNLLAGDTFLTFDDVRNRARIPLPTAYFNYPEEELSDAEALFHDRDKRAWLLQQSPAVYAVAKELDQERIDRQLGKTDDGQPLFIRNPEGDLVSNTTENQKIIQLFEDSARSTKSID